MATNKIEAWYQEFIVYYTRKAFASRYARVALIGIGVVAASLLGLVGYAWHKKGSLQKLQLVLSQCIAEYQKALFAAPERIKIVEDMIQVGSKQAYGTMYEPYFMALQVEMLIQRDEMDQAIAAIKQVLDKLPKNYDLYPLFAIKAALMQVDTDQLQQAGLEQLNELAYDTGLKNRDQALYYLGAYYWGNNDLEKAIQIWNDLLAWQREHLDTMSPWSLLAVQKLSTIPGAVQQEII